MGGGTQCTLGRGGVTAVAHRARCNARAGPRWCHVSRAQPNLRNWRKEEKKNWRIVFTSIPKASKKKKTKKRWCVFCVLAARGWQTAYYATASRKPDSHRWIFREGEKNPTARQPVTTRASVSCRARGGQPLGTQRGKGRSTSVHWARREWEEEPSARWAAAE